MQTKHMSAVLALIILLLLCIVLVAGLIGNTVSAAITTKNVTVSVSNIDAPALIMPDKPREKWRITAYCGCATCCGKYADNRPEGKVVGAAGVELVQGVSCAARGLPLGTVVRIDGIGEFIVQDRTSKEQAELYDNKLIDLYFADHEAARAFGVKHLEVYCDRSASRFV